MTFKLRQLLIKHICCQYLFVQKVTALHVTFLFKGQWRSLNLLTIRVPHGGVDVCFRPVCAPVGYAFGASGMPGLNRIGVIWEDHSIWINMYIGSDWLIKMTVMFAYNKTLSLNWSKDCGNLDRSLLVSSRRDHSTIPCTNTRIVAELNIYQTKPKTTKSHIGYIHLILSCTVDNIEYAWFFTCKWSALFWCRLNCIRFIDHAHFNRLFVQFKTVKFRLTMRYHP